MATHCSNVCAGSSSVWCSNTPATARADLQGLLRLAEEVADHPDVVCAGQFDEHDDVRALLGERRVHRMPDALVAVDDPLRCGLLVVQIEGEATVAEELRPPLPAAACNTALEEQSLALQPLPERRVEAVVGGRRLGETGLEVRGAGVHGVVLTVSPRCRRWTS